MERKEFQEHISKRIEDALKAAESASGTSLSRRIEFCWSFKTEDRISSGIVEQIWKRVYLGPNEIYPCVDMGVIDRLQDGTPILSANVCGYSPRAFQKNWTGQDGPFVIIVGMPFLEKAKGLPPSVQNPSMVIQYPELKRPPLQERIKLWFRRLRGSHST